MRRMHVNNRPVLAHGRLKIQYIRSSPNSCCPFRMLILPSLVVTHPRRIRAASHRQLLSAGLPPLTPIQTLLSVEVHLEIPIVPATGKFLLHITPILDMMS